MQLPLNVGLRDDATLDSYFPAKNRQVWQHVSLVAQGKGDHFLYLWGPSGVGLTHLLQGACFEAHEKGLAAFYISCEQLLENPDILQGLEHVTLVCLDNVHVVAGDNRLEEAIFHLFNRLKDENKFLLVTSHTPPMQLPLHLADLKSRLSWGVTYHLHPLSDEEKLSALILRANIRGLTLSKEVGRFIVTRCGRSMTKLYAILDELDKASLIEQRRLTIPFVKKVLSL